jgi:hypothetical protein
VRHDCAQAAEKSRNVRYTTFFAQATYSYTDGLCNDTVEDDARMSSTFNSGPQLSSRSVPDIVRYEQSDQNRGVNRDSNEKETYALRPAVKVCAQWF